MKVKFYLENHIGNLENEIDNFIKDKKVIDIKLQTTNGYIIVMILYKEN